MDRLAWGWQWSGARRQLSEVTMRNMTEAVDIIPNLVVCKGKKMGSARARRRTRLHCPSRPRKEVDICDPRQSRFRLRRFRPLWKFPLSVQSTAAATPDRSRLLCLGRPRKLDSSYLRHLNRLCRRRRLRPRGKLLFCVERTTAASFIRPSSRMSRMKWNMNWTEPPRSLTPPMAPS